MYVRKFWHLNRKVKRSKRWNKKMKYANVKFGGWGYKIPVYHMQRLVFDPQNRGLDIVVCSIQEV